MPTFPLPSLALEQGAASGERSSLNYPFNFIADGRADRIYNGRVNWSLVPGVFVPSEIVYHLPLPPLSRTDHSHRTRRYCPRERHIQTSPRCFIHCFRRGVCSTCAFLPYPAPSSLPPSTMFHPRNCSSPVLRSATRFCTLFLSRERPSCAAVPHDLAETANRNRDACAVNRSRNQPAKAETETVKRNNRNEAGVRVRACESSHRLPFFLVDFGSRRFVSVIEGGQRTRAAQHGLPG